VHDKKEKRRIKSYCMFFLPMCQIKFQSIYKYITEVELIKLQVVCDRKMKHPFPFIINVQLSSQRILIFIIYFALVVRQERITGKSVGLSKQYEPQSLSHRPTKRLPAELPFHLKPHDNL